MSVSHLFVTFAQPQFQSYEVETLHADSDHESASLRLVISRRVIIRLHIIERRSKTAALRAALGKKG